MSNTETIGIIGGKGKMGASFAEYFEKKGFPVLIADIDTELSNKKVAQKSDVVIITVPIKKTEEVIREIAPNMQKDSLLMDFTSVKSAPLKAMMKYFDGSVLGCHPMFGPSNLFPGQTIIFCPGRGKKWQKRMEEIFSEFSLVEISNEEHDKAMAYVQGLQHFLEIVFAKTTAESGLSKETLLNVASPIYRMQIALVARVLGQDSSLSSHIVHGSDFAEKAISAFVDTAKNLLHKGTDAFEEAFIIGQEFFGEYCYKAKEETDELIQTLLNDKIPPSPSKKGGIPLDKRGLGDLKKKQEKATIGLLGPKYTWSDLAVNSFFPEESKNLYSNFSSVFHALEKGEIEYGFLPTENKISGTVREVWDGISRGKYIIQSIFEFPIHHVFATKKENQEISTIFGHEAALSQCSDFMHMHYPYAKKVAVASTTEAVLRAKDMRNAGAICTKIAAEKNDLIIAQENIADTEGNVTRFALISKKREFSGKGASPLVQSSGGNRLHLTTLFFELINEPGSLLSFLQIFADAGKNLVRLESRPTGKSFSDYAFYIDFEGELDQNLHSKLQEYSKNLIILGENYKVISSQSQ